MNTTLARAWAVVSPENFPEAGKFADQADDLIFKALHGGQDELDEVLDLARGAIQLAFIAKQALSEVLTLRAKLAAIGGCVDAWSDGDGSTLTLIERIETVLA